MNQILSLQAERISQLSGPNVLKAGSSVYVKIIADKGNGQYLGSVAGNRVNISSSKNLQVGSSFVATINSKDGVIYITPKNIQAQGTGQVPVQVQPLQPGQLSNILASLGVPTTELSGNLLKMMMVTEMKVDGGVLRGLYSLALKQKGKEKAAGEILLLLKDKGIEPTEEELKELLYYLEREGDAEDNGESFQSFNDDKAKNLINKSNKVQGGWVILPYNLVENNENTIGAGIIRILFDKSDRLKKLNLNCYYNNKEFLFSLNFENKKCKKILFNINPAEKSEAKYVETLGKYIEDKNIEIAWAQANLIEGCGSEGEEIISFQGEA